MLKSFIIIIIFLDFYLPGQCQDTNQIINQYFDKVGRLDNWKNLKSIRLDRYVWMNLDVHGSKLNDLTKNATMDVHEEYIEYPDKQKMVIYQNLIDKGVIYNIRGQRFLITQGLKRETKPRPLYKFNPMRVEACYSDKRLKIELEEHNEIKYYKLSCETEASHYYFFLNKETFVIDFHWSADRPDLITYLSHYKMIDGYLIPFKKEMQRDGIIFFRSEIQDIKINPAFNATTFIVPD